MYLKVRVTPGARKERIIEVSDDALAVTLKEKAERNMANDRAREIVAEHCRVPLTRVRLVAGFRSPNKVFSID